MNEQSNWYEKCTLCWWVNFNKIWYKQNRFMNILMEWYTFVNRIRATIWRYDWINVRLAARLAYTYLWNECLAITRVVYEPVGNDDVCYDDYWRINEFVFHRILHLLLYTSNMISNNVYFLFIDWYIYQFTSTLCLFCFPRNIYIYQLIKKYFSSSLYYVEVKFMQIKLCLQLIKKPGYWLKNLHLHINEKVLIAVFWFTRITAWF